MQKLPVAIAMAIMLALSAFCQVDTLMLVEVNSFEVSGNITQIYTESIRDNYKEIFICTDNHIYVYDSQTNELIWSRGELINPQDLLFEDINNDGFKDLAFRDSLNIFLYDVINSDLIWMSPVLDSTYKFYTIGDRNDDGYIDVAIMSKEPFTRPFVYENYDTVWVELFDGPEYITQNCICMLMENYSFTYGDGSYISKYEVPSSIFIKSLSNDGELNTYIIIFSSYNYYHISPHGNWGQGLSGNCWIIDANDFDFNVHEDIGNNIHSNQIFQSNIPMLYSMTNDDHSSSVWDNYYFRHQINYNNIYPENFDSIQIWYYDSDINPGTWHGFVDGDINEDNEGWEICYSINGGLFLYPLPYSTPLWIISGISVLQSVKFIFSSDYIFEHSQIICIVDSNYYFFDGTEGSLEAILAGPISISQVSDLNNDNNDELLSINGSTLNIYNLEYYVSIENPSAVPRSMFLKANYPNPFNSSTIIEYALNSKQQVTLEIYDLLGRHVETLVDDYQTTGLHQTVWKAEKASSGIYFYKLIAGDFVKAKKMLMLK